MQGAPRQRLVALATLIAFAGIMVLMFALSYHVRIPWVLEQPRTADPFVRALQDNYNAISSRYSKDVAQQFVTLRVLGIPLVVLSVVVGLRWVLSMAGLALTKLSINRHCVLFVIGLGTSFFAVHQAFYSTDAMDVAGQRVLPSARGPLAGLIEYWFFYVAMTPGMLIAQIVLAVAVVATYFGKTGND